MAVRGLISAICWYPSSSSSRMDRPQSLMLIALVSAGNGFEPVTSRHESCDIDHCTGIAYLIKKRWSPPPQMGQLIPVKLLTRFTLCSVRDHRFRVCLNNFILGSVDRIWPQLDPVLFVNRSKTVPIFFGIQYFISKRTLLPRCSVQLCFRRIQRQSSISSSVRCQIQPWVSKE